MASIIRVTHLVSLACLALVLFSSLLSSNTSVMVMASEVFERTTEIETMSMSLDMDDCLSCFQKIKALEERQQILEKENHHLRGVIHDHLMKSRIQGDTEKDDILVGDDKLNLSIGGIVDMMVEREERRLETNPTDITVMRGIAAWVRSKVSSWKTNGDPCGSAEWQGVTCANGQVISISLSDSSCQGITNRAHRYSIYIYLQKCIHQVITP
jgi:hypothetical protein